MIIFYINATTGKVNMKWDKWFTFIFYVVYRNVVCTLFIWVID